MKKLILYLIIGFVFINSLPAQIVYRQVSAVVHGFQHKQIDSFDIEGDGVFDIRMVERILLDIYIVYDSVLSNDLGVTDYPIDFGLPFYFDNNRHPQGLITETRHMFCAGWGWSNGIPKYKGFYRLHPNGDTTYGWIKYNSVGDSTLCTDTVTAMEVGYSLIPNVKLYAGQTRILTPGTISMLSAWPTITRGPLKIQSHYNSTKQIFVFDSGRRKLARCIISPGQIISMDLSFLSAGFYFIQSEDSDWGLKIIKQ